MGLCAGLGLRLIACHPAGAPDTEPAPAALRISAADSAEAVAIAAAALDDRPEKFRVVTFHLDPDGVLVRLHYADPEMIGGGGLVWVRRGNEYHTVLLRYQ